MKQASELSYAVRFPVLLKYFGLFCLVIAALTLVPLGMSLFWGETHVSMRYLVVAAAMGGLGSALSRVSVPSRIQDNEAMVLAAWLFLFTPLVMTYPLMATGLRFLDALFEAISGVTTTGFSTLPTVEGASPAASSWRMKKRSSVKVTRWSFSRTAKTCQPFASGGSRSWPRMNHNPAGQFFALNRTKKANPCNHHDGFDTCKPRPAIA